MWWMPRELRAGGAAFWRVPQHPWSAGLRATRTVTVLHESNTSSCRFPRKTGGSTRDVFDHGVELRQPPRWSDEGELHLYPLGREHYLTCD